MSTLSRIEFSLRDYRGVAQSLDNTNFAFVVTFDTNVGVDGAAAERLLRARGGEEEGLSLDARNASCPCVSRRGGAHFR